MKAPSLAWRATVLLVSALVAGGAVLAVGSRPDLQDAGRRIDAAWGQLRPALDERYRAVAQANEAASERLAGEPVLAVETVAALSDWRRARVIETQVAAANRLEGLTARLQAAVAATPRLRTAAEVTEALAAVENAEPEEARRIYNETVAAYEAVRGGFPRRLVAGVLGFDTRRTLEIPT